MTVVATIHNYNSVTLTNFFASMSHGHIFGASGSGTTTLGHALSRRLGVLFLDADTFLETKRTSIREKHQAAHRIEMIECEIADRRKLPL